MAAPTPPDPDAVAFARERKAAGLSLSAIAEEMAAVGYPVTPMTLSRWLRDPAAAVEPRGPRRSKAKASTPRQALAGRAPAPPEQEPDADPGTLEAMRAILTRTIREVEAQRIINPKLAQQLGRDVGTYAAIVSRLEKGAEDDADQLRFSRREVDQAMTALLERVKAVCDRPLLCAECSRKLSVDWGTGGVESVSPDR